MTKPDAADLLILLGTIDIELPVVDLSEELAAAAGIDVSLCKKMIISLRTIMPKHHLRLTISTKSTN